MSSNPSATKKKKSHSEVWHQWLTSVILATQEAEIRRETHHRKGLVEWLEV
jgi:hypothetical protein